MNLGGFEIDKKNIIIACAVLVVFIIGWNVFSQLRDITKRTGSIRSDISAIRTEQSRSIKRIESIENGLEDSAQKAGNISEGISEVTGSVIDTEKRIDTSEDRLNSSAELIREGQSIIQSVKQRNEVKN